MELMPIVPPQVGWAALAVVTVFFVGWAVCLHVLGRKKRGHKEPPEKP